MGDDNGKGDLGGMLGLAGVACWRWHGVSWRDGGSSGEVAGGSDVIYYYLLYYGSVCCSLHRHRSSFDLNYQEEEGPVSPDDGWPGCWEWRRRRRRGWWWSQTRTTRADGRAGRMGGLMGGLKGRPMGGGWT
jgi:hypothetical protein